MSRLVPVTRDSVTTTSAAGKRIPVFPAEVRGPWNRRRQWVQWALIALYLFIPWIKIDGHPLVLLDVEHRRFSLFGQLFFAQEVPNLVFIAFSFILTVGLVTAWFGRVWCGWSCPQTVFIERIFRAIERRIEGDPVRQRGLHAAPWGPGKVLKKSLKWLVFSGISLVLSHSFLAYFVGETESFRMMTQAPGAHPTSFLVVMVFTGIVLFDFGWFREQFCLVACPYGRFQSVMMDDSSLFIHYDSRREDCIDCHKCVAACPTGIDIRNGMQMECIACTSCADACDSVMQKIHKPKGLIAYQSLRLLEGKPFRLLRGRPLVYLTLLAICLSMLGNRLARRTPYSAEVTRAIDTPYQVVKGQDGREYLLNHFKVHFANLGWETLHPRVSLEVADLREGAELILPPGEQAAPKALASGEGREFDVFLKIPKARFQDLNRESAVPLVTHWHEGIESRSPMKLIGPSGDL